MAGDIYGDALETLDEQAPAPGADPKPSNTFLQTLDELTSQHTTQLKVAQRQAVDTTPDHAAEVRRIGVASGLGPDVVERNFADLSKRHKVEQLPYAQIQQDTPALATWATDPGNAAVAHDDMEQLGALEWLVSAPQRAIIQATYEDEYARLRSKSLFGSLTAAEHAQMETARVARQTGGELGAGNSWFRGAITSTMKILTSLSQPELLPTVAGGGGGAVLGAAGGALLGGVGAVPGAIAGAKLGAEAGYTYGLASSAFQSGVASAYDELLALKDSLGQPMNPTVAKYGALLNGAINAGLMVFGGKAIAAGMEAGGKRIGGMLAKDAIKTALSQPSVAGAVAELAKTYGIALTEGVALNVAMKTGDILSVELSKIAGTAANARADVVPNAAAETTTLSPQDEAAFQAWVKANKIPDVGAPESHYDYRGYWKEFGDKPITFGVDHFTDTYKQHGHPTFSEESKYSRGPGDGGTWDGETFRPSTRGGTFEMRTPGEIGGELLHAAESGVQSFALISAVGPLRGVAGELRRAERAQQGPLFFQALGEGIEQSKTAKRLPEAAQAFLAQATKDGPVATIYAPVDTWTQYWQDKGVDPAAMAETVTGRPDAYADALKTGENLPIPTARYAVTLAATEHNAFFANELRLGPDEMNGREAAALIESMKTAPDQPAEPAPASPVYTAALEQLTQGGGLSEETAKHYAGLVDQAFGTMAERSGVDPTELYKSYGLTVGRPDLQAGDAPKAGEPPASGAYADYARQFDAETADPGTAVFLGYGPDGPLYNVQGGPSDRSTLSAAGLARLGIPVPETPADTGERITGAQLRTKVVEARIARELIDRQADAAQNPGDYLNAEARNVPAAQEGSRPADAQGQQPGADVVGAVQRGGDGDVAQPGGPAPRGVPGLDEVFAKEPADATAARLTPEVERNLRWILEELQNFPYIEASWDFLVDENAARGKSGNAAGGNANRRPAVGGAPVYNDVLGYSPVNTKTVKGEKVPAREPGGSRAKVEAAIVKLLETRHVTTNLMEGALRVAENRHAGNWRDLERPLIPPPWGEPVPPEFTDALSTAIDQATEPGNMLEDAGLEGDAVDAGGPADTSFNIDEFSQSLFDDLQPPHPTADTLTVPANVDELAARRLGMPAGLANDVNLLLDEQRWTEAVTTAGAHITLKDGTPGVIVRPAPDPVNGGRALVRHELDGQPVERFYSALELTPAAAPTADVNAHGEVQPRLPGDAGAVRETNVATPTFEAPFSLTSEIAKPRKGGQTTLFQGPLPNLTPAHVEAWAEEVKARAGSDLQGFSIVLTPEGDLFLESLIVDRGAQRAGLGSKAMRELTRFADLNGRRITLTPAQPGDIGPGEPTSTGRLVKFYKRFGFVENTGRNRDFSTSESMYREPTLLRDLGQPLFHGSPHDFERFSLEHVGTGEGAAAYGHGLYFAENPNVARDYRDHVIDKAWFDRTNARLSAIASELDTLRKGDGTYGRDARSTQLKADYDRLLDERAAKAGTLYQVDIPDEHIGRMLDWDATFADQPASVRAALKQLGVTQPEIRKQGGSYHVIRIDGEVIGSSNTLAQAQMNAASAMTGEAIYHRLVQGEERRLNDEHPQRIGLQRGLATKAASDALAAAGVPGLRYLDQGSRDIGVGTRNVVVFDDSIVTLTHKDGKPFTPAERKEFFQGGGGGERPATPRRGVIRFGPDRQFNIDLLERADLSTFLHETGHFFLEVFGDLVDQVSAIPLEQLTEDQKHLLHDYGVTLQALGVENRREIGTPQHEQFATLFEAYLREGKAPSLALQTPFARFRAWLLSIYGSLQKLNVNLTPEVRGVFDRMLASDHAIAEAEQQRGVTQMFLTPEAAGMDPAEFQLYARTVRDAHQQAQERLDGKLLREVFREQTRAWKEQRAEIRTAVEGDVQQRPEYRALAAMKNGTHPNGEPLVEGLETPPLVLSRAILEERFWPDRIKRLPRGIVGTEGGLDPDLVASMFGYSSADAMLTAVEKAPAMRDVIERETKRRMLEQHGSILLDGSLHDTAQGAVANETHDEVIRAEMRALGRLRRTVDPFVKAERAKGRSTLEQERAERDYERRWFEAEAKLRIAIAEGHKQVEIDTLTQQVRDLKAQARGGAAVIRNAIPDAATLKAAAVARINAMRIGDIQPATFWSASRRAGQQALDRAARQDFDGAITAKQQELINLNLYRQAETAKETVDAGVELARTLDGKASRARIGISGGSYQDQIDGILDRFDFAKVSQKALARRAELRKWVEGIEAQGLPVDLPDDLLNETRRQHYTDLTLEEFTGVVDGLKQIQHLARIATRLFKANERATLDETAGTIGQSIRDKFTGKPPTVVRDRSKGEKARIISNFMASHVRLADYTRELDGQVDGGPLTSAIAFRLNEAGGRESTMTAEATARFGELLETAYPRSQKRFLHEKLEIPEIGQSLSKTERIMVALNWGNEGNRERQRVYEHWTDDQVQAILETLDARDLTLVQGILDQVNSYRQAIIDKQTRVYGVAPVMVDPVPIRTSKGEIPGGYFPLKYDDRLAGNVSDFDAGNLAKLAAYTQATTQRGHTKERTSNVKLPIRRDTGVIFQHVQQVIHDLTHHEALIDIGRILGHRSVQTAILETHGDIVYKQIKDAIRDVAIGQPRSTEGFSGVLQHVRSGAAIAGLGWSATVPMLHLSGAIPKGINAIGAEWAAKGLMRWYRGPETMQATAEWINDNNAIMAGRGRTQTRELSEIRSAVGVDTGRFSGWVAEVLDKTTHGMVDKQKIADSYFYLVTKAQQIADYTVYLGQYEKSRAAGEPEDRAHAIAGQRVLDAFGGGQIKDLPSVMRGGPLLKTWTTFYGPFNSTFNAMRLATKRVEGTPLSVGRLAVDYAMLWIVPAALGFGVRAAMQPGAAGSAEEWNAETLSKELGRASVAYLADMMVGTRELAGAIHGYHNYEGPAGASIFAKLGHLYQTGEHVAQKVAEGKTDEILNGATFKALDDVGGILFHYPAGQLGRTVGGIAAMIDGRTQNPAALLFGPPKKGTP